jgi:HSP20 family molecular chaperone IbpA
MDINESENALEVTAALPGVSDLRIEGDVLAIRGEKRKERQDQQAHVVERSYGSFQRSVQLPFAPDPAQVEAHFGHGVLTVVLPKSGTSWPPMSKPTSLSMAKLRFMLTGPRTKKPAPRFSNATQSSTVPM